MGIDRASRQTRMPPPALLIASRIPLAASGVLRRFREDPWRGWAAATRAAPWLRRWAPDPGVGLNAVLRAVAEDRLDDARAAAGELTDPIQQRAARAAIRRCAGEILAVASSVPRSLPERRQVRAARRDVALWTSALPVWAGRHHDRDADRPAALGGPSDTASQGLRVMHVVTNALPRVQAGSTIRTHRVASAQQDAGWNVCVVTRPGFPVFHGDVLAPSDRIHDGVEYVSLLPAVMPAADRIFDTYADRLGRAIDERQPHVLHAASDHVNARAALEAGRRRDLPVAYEARTLPEESWLSRHGGEAARHSDTFRLMRRRHREVLLAADVVTTLGEHLRTAICEQGVDPARVFVVPNAVPESMLMPRMPAEHARESLGIHEGELWLGTVTTMYGYEGLATLVEATAELRRSGVDARLLLVGDGPERDRWLALAQQRAVPTTAPGRVPVGNVVDYLDAIDVFVLPRRDDAITRWVTALKPLEAQARGIPVVGSDLPAVAEVLAPGSALVPGEDSRDWARALSRYLDRGVREEDGARARDWVGACRTWPSVLDGYRSAYAFLGVNPGEPITGPGSTGGATPR